MLTSDLLGKAFLQYLLQQEEALEKAMASEMQSLLLIQTRIGEDEKALNEVRDLIEVVKQAT